MIKMLVDVVDVSVSRLWTRTDRGVVIIVIDVTFWYRFGR